MPKQLLSIFSVFTAALLLCSQAQALLIDANDRVTNNTQTGWASANLNNINNVTFTGVGGVFLDDRDRGAGNTNGLSGDIANNDMWRDFIFADERNQTIANPSAAGIDITIANLLANKVYSVNLWAFDDSSNGGRNMLWNGNALNIPNGPDPTSLADQVVSFQAVSNGSGVLTLEGRIGSVRGACCNVFVNGLEVTAVPEPTTLALFGLGLLGLGFAGRKKA